MTDRVEYWKSHRGWLWLHLYGAKYVAHRTGFKTKWHAFENCFYSLQTNDINPTPALKAYGQCIGGPDCYDHVVRKSMCSWHNKKHGPSDD